MKLKIISKLLITTLFLSNINISSLASTWSDDGRSETFEGENFDITEVLEEDISDFEIGGNTLVNLLGSQGKTETSHNNIDKNYRYFFDINLAPNKQYTFIANIYGITNYNTSPLKLKCQYKDKTGQYVEVYPEGHVAKTNINNGQSAITFTSTQELYDCKIVLYTDYVDNSGCDEFDFTLYDCMLLEGNWSNKITPNYFEGIKSVGEGRDGFSLVKSNKNLLDIDYELTFDTKLLMLTNKIEKGTYSISYEDIEGFNNGERVVIAFHDKSGVIKDVLLRDKVTEISIPRVADRVYLYSNNHNWTDSLGYFVTIRGLQIEEGDATTYVKHKKELVPIALKEPLRGIPGGAKDRIVNINNEWYIERNCKQITIDDKSDNWFLGTTDDGWAAFDDSLIIYIASEAKSIKENTMFLNSNLPYLDNLCNLNFVGITNQSWFGNGHIAIRLNETMLDDLSYNSCLKWLEENPQTLVYELKAPYYERIEVNEFELFKDKTYISSDSTVPANIKITLDRTANKALEAIEEVKLNPTTENLAKARMWTNMLKESTLKDNFQDELSNITQLKDLTLDRKTSTANLDIYIKSENMLSMSLDTNSVTFDSYSGAAPMELKDAVNITINSSLPYDLNAYMPIEISNSDGSEVIPFNIFNIKESNETAYKQFVDTTNKVVLKADCMEGNNNEHSIDLKLDSNIAHTADIYKTVVRFEAIQK